MGPGTSRTSGARCDVARFGLVAGLLVGKGWAHRLWALAITTVACFGVGLLTSEWLFGWATEEDLQPNVDGLSRDEVLLSSVLTTAVVVLAMPVPHTADARRSASAGTAPRPADRARLRQRDPPRGAHRARRQAQPLIGIVRTSMVRRWFARAGVPLPHGAAARAFRHTVAMQLVGCGAALNVVQALLQRVPELDADLHPCGWPPCARGCTCAAGWWRLTGDSKDTTSG